MRKWTPLPRGVDWRNARCGGEGHSPPLSPGSLLYSGVGISRLESNSPSLPIPTAMDHAKGAHCHCSTSSLTLPHLYDGGTKLQREGDESSQTQRGHPLIIHARPMALRQHTGGVKGVINLHSSPILRSISLCEWGECRVGVRTQCRTLLALQFHPNAAVAACEDQGGMGRQEGARIKGE